MTSPNIIETKAKDRSERFNLQQSTDVNTGSRLCIMKNLPLSQPADWTTLKDGSISEFFGVIPLSALRSKTCVIRKYKLLITEIERSAGCLVKKCSHPVQYHHCSSWYNQFKWCSFFTGYQSLLSGQQGFQGLMGVQQPPQSQGMMSSHQGTPVQSVMLSYPTVSNYQVHISNLENCVL